MRSHKKAGTTEEDETCECDAKLGFVMGDDGQCVCRDGYFFRDSANGEGGNQHCEGTTGAEGLSGGMKAPALDALAAHKPAFTCLPRPPLVPLTCRTGQVRQVPPQDSVRADHRRVRLQPRLPRQGL